MIIPSIDLSGGQAVQLIGGKTLAIEAGDPEPLARCFRVAGEIAVIDLDEALGRGSNRSVIERVLPLARCRVGGGIRSVEAALGWLELGAEKVILGTKAVPEVLEHLPKARVIAALDADHGEVVVKGWTEKTGHTIESRMDVIDHLVSGYLVTFVEREGRLGGIDLEAVARLVAKTGKGRLTVAGGVTTLEELAAIDAMGADAQVGMALYTGRMRIEDAMLEPLAGPGPWPIAVTEPGGRLVWVGPLEREALLDCLRTGEVRFAGLSSNTPLRSFTPTERRDGAHVVIQTEARTAKSVGLAALEATLFARRVDAPAGSYTHRLFNEEGLLAAKLLEEAKELAEATTESEIVHEAADVLYFALARAAASGVGLRAIEAELDRRAKLVKRRGGDRK